MLVYLYQLILKGLYLHFTVVFFPNTFSRLALLFVLHLLENCTTLYYKPKCTIQISNINNNAVAKTIFRINKRNFLFNKLEQFIFFKYLFWLSIDQLIVLKICLFKRKTWISYSGMTVKSCHRLISVCGINGNITLHCFHRRPRLAGIWSA